MKILIIKAGASGDVLRTTFLLELFKNDTVHWFTTEKNKCLASGNVIITDPSFIDIHYDWVINLEEDGNIIKPIEDREGTCQRWIGPYLGEIGTVYYQPCPNKWFDMSRISRLGKENANRLKWENRQSYQELICEMLGKSFGGEKYVAPKLDTHGRIITGDVGIIVSDESPWPTKNWAYLEELGNYLSYNGLKINFLKRRSTISQHIADITGHKVIVCGDSLPMHVCIAYKIPCVALFNCTSPWEIESYGIVNKVVSPLLQDHFYKTGYNDIVARSISFDDVLNAVNERLQQHAK